MALDRKCIRSDLRSLAPTKFRKAKGREHTASGGQYYGQLTSDRSREKGTK